MKQIYKMVDLFTCWGELSLGLEQAGFTTCFVNEIVETYWGNDAKSGAF